MHAERIWLKQNWQKIRMWESFKNAFLTDLLGFRMFPHTRFEHRQRRRLKAWIFRESLKFNERWNFWKIRALYNSDPLSERWKKWRITNSNNTFKSCERFFRNSFQLWVELVICDFSVLRRWAMIFVFKHPKQSSLKRR